jgi:TPP-dependent pyruvate/acetoin dehydrogenase alpha subunit
LDHELMLQVTADGRAGEGPAIIESRTYGLQGHFVADPANYRPQE